MKQYGEEFYYYRGYGDAMYAATRCVYGLPSDDDISYEAAMAIAKAEALQHGISAERYDLRTKGVSFDVTNPDSPKWKIWPTMAYSDDFYEWVEEDAISFYIEIDAKTGDILLVDLKPVFHGRY